uniref:Uncharacterized protein n=1 Tax=Triticum urartu TaxID=4572 RepID=A0A8R7TD90_TRIUA
MLAPADVPSMPALWSGDAGREAEVIGGWQLVMSRKGPRRPALAAPAFKPPPIPRWLFRRCCRCLFHGHMASVCPPPLPRPAAAFAQALPSCPGRGWEVSAPFVPPHALPGACPQRQESAPRAMAAVRPGDASLRPAEDFVVVPATPEMQVDSTLLSTNAAVAWLEGDRQDVSCLQVAVEIAAALGARKADVEVVKHYPERFFVRFVYQHHCADAVSRDFLAGAGYRIFVRQWRIEDHAENGDMLQH